MTILFIGSVLLGAVFGRFFKFWVLVPACVVILAIVSVSSVFYGHGLLSTLFEFALLATGMQIGYVSSLLSYIIADGSRRLKKPHPAASIAVTRRHNRAA